MRFGSSVPANLVNILVLDAARGRQVVVADDLGETVFQVADVRLDLVEIKVFRSVTSV